MDKRWLLLSLLLPLEWATGSPLSSAGHVKRDNAFDYVIVGGGTAGLVLADRLSADGVYLTKLSMLMKEKLMRSRQIESLW